MYLFIGNQDLNRDVKFTMKKKEKKKCTEEYN